MYMIYTAKYEYTNGRNARIITVRSECSGYDKKKNN